MKEVRVPMIDVNVKELIFLVVFVATIAVPIIASILTKKKKENSGKEKDKK
jgi:biopolymer transport protein ExbD